MIEISLPSRSDIRFILAVSFSFLVVARQKEFSRPLRKDRKRKHHVIARMKRNILADPPWCFFLFLFLGPPDGATSLITGKERRQDQAIVDEALCLTFCRAYLHSTLHGLNVFSFPSRSTLNLTVPRREEKRGSGQRVGFLDPAHV